MTGGGGEGGGGEGGSAGGAGGGGAQSAESPAKSKLRPRPGPDPAYVTVNVASMYPSCGRKKNCTPRLAWSSLNDSGFVGKSSSSSAVPFRAVPVNMRVCSLTTTLETMLLPDAARRGFW